MTWNYRIIKSKWRLKDLKGVCHAVHQVYYDKDGNPMSWSAEPAYLAGDEPTDIMDDIVRIRQAFKRPILEIKDEKLVEVLPTNH